jgi:hypothetical protein
MIEFVVVMLLSPFLRERRGRARERDESEVEVK